MFTPFAFVKTTPIAPGATYFLDTYSGASRAYSVRRLSSTYNGYCMRVRRVADNQDLDVGFIGENLDTGSINSFIGPLDTGKVIVWYDQSGNGKDASGFTASSPTINLGGTTLTIGSKPAMDGLNCVLEFEEINTIQRYSQIVVAKRPSANTNILGFSANLGGSPLLAHYNDNNFYFQWQNFYVNSTATNTSADHEVLLASTTSTSTAVIQRNGSNIALDTPISFGINTILNCVMKYGGAFSNARFQEMILYPTEQNANFAGMQTNINAYYSIY